VRACWSGARVPGDRNRLETLTAFRIWLPAMHWSGVPGRRNSFEFLKRSRCGFLSCIDQARAFVMSVSMLSACVGCPQQLYVGCPQQLYALHRDASSAFVYCSCTRSVHVAMFRCLALQGALHAMWCKDTILVEQASNAHLLPMQTSAAPHKVQMSSFVMLHHCVTKLSAHQGALQANPAGSWGPPQSGVLRGRPPRFTATAGHPAAGHHPGRRRPDPPALTASGSASGRTPARSTVWQVRGSPLEKRFEHACDSE
jgi:hypothetical protein